MKTMSEVLEPSRPLMWAAASALLWLVGIYVVDTFLL